MGLGNNRVALYEPLSSDTSGSTGSAETLLQAVPTTMGWWDASFPDGLLGTGNSPVGVWNAPGKSLIDLTGSGQSLSPFLSPVTSALPQTLPHLSGLLGGAGFPTTTAGLLQPALDPSAGWQLSAPPVSPNLTWSWYLVWSRPNWRQGTSFDMNAITLLKIGAQAILQVDSNGGGNRLILFPGSGQVVVSTHMARRHTHSIVIRYSPLSGADLWLDDVLVATSAHPTSGTFSGPVLLLHDGSFFGAAQCWFHEAAMWNRALSDSEVAAVVGYAKRWTRGVRKGYYLLVNGQSNAINYSMNDGAAAILARGITWCLGGLAYNVLATTGSATKYTMQSGHGIYPVTSAGYPGSFVADPGIGSDPSGWPLGADGLAVQRAVADLPAEDLADLCAIVWPWNETDSLRLHNEYGTFRSAALRFLALLRTMVGDTDANIPVVWWNAIPYGPADGMTMHRQVVQDISSDRTNNVIVGNPQTSDSNPRGSSWDSTTGISTGGDGAHRDGADNQRFAMLATPVVARTLSARGFGDSIASIPQALPKTGGPVILHAYKQAVTTLILTVAHDGGDDVKIPLQATTGIGFSVMDGGAPGNAGVIVPAVSCQRVDATHLRIILSRGLQNSSGSCRLFYPYGSAQIGRGNVVTDNFSAMPMPVGWNAVTDLGTSWSLDCPLSATFSGIPLSDTPL